MAREGEGESRIGGCRREGEEPYTWTVRRRRGGYGKEGVGEEPYRGQ